MSVEVLNGREPGEAHPTARAAWLARVSAWSRSHRRLLIVAVVLVVVALGLDQWQQQRTLHSLLDTVAADEATIADADMRVDGVVDYWRPVLSGSGFTDAVRASFTEDLAAVGQQGADRMQAARASLGGVTVLAWHNDAQAAVLAYDERLAAWEQFFSGLTTDPETLYAPADARRATARDAEQALLVAIPAAGSTNDRVRIEALLGSGHQGAGS